MTDRPGLMRRQHSAQASLAGFCPTKERAAWAYLDAAIWPARRPLAACPAALIATLLPDPGWPEDARSSSRDRGRVVQVVRKRSCRAERSRRRSPRKRSVASSTGDANPTRLSRWCRPGIPEDVRRPGVEGARPLCGWRLDSLEAMRLAARPRPSTSIPWPGSSSSVHSNTRRSSQASTGPSRSSPSNRVSSWPASSKRRNRLHEEATGAEPRRRPAPALPRSRRGPGVARPRVGLVGSSSRPRGPRPLLPHLCGLRAARRHARQAIGRLSRPRRRRPSPRLRRHWPRTIPSPSGTRRNLEARRRPNSASGP